MHGHADVCRAILEREAFKFANAFDKERSTALHLAAARKHPECVQAICDSEIFQAVNELDLLKRTALHLAAIRADLECYEIIIAHEDCDPAIIDHHGKPAPE